MKLALRLGAFVFACVALMAVSDARAQYYQEQQAGKEQAGNFDDPHRAGSEGAILPDSRASYDELSKEWSGNQSNQSTSKAKTKGDDTLSPFMKPDKPVDAPIGTGLPQDLPDLSNSRVPLKNLPLPPPNQDVSKP